MLLCMVNGVACMAMSMAPSADGMELRIASSSLAVVSTMRIPRDSHSAARKRGTVPENRIAFGLKTENSSRVMQTGLDEMCIRDRAIKGHATYLNVPRNTLMAKTLFAVDELTGLVTACVLVRPDRSIASLEVKSAVSYTHLAHARRLCGVVPERESGP